MSSQLKKKKPLVLPKRYNNMKKKKILLISFALYLIGTLIGYGIFSRIGAKHAVLVPKEAQTTDYQGLVFDHEPKTEPCPLSGAYFSKKQKSWWEGHRPLGVMIENHF